MKNLTLGFKRNNVNNVNNISMRQYNSPRISNPLLQPRSVSRQQVSMFSSVRRPCAQLQFGGSPGCGCS